MTVDHNRLFEQLEPPPGGAEKLRRRLEEASARPGGLRFEWAAAGVAAAALLVAVVWIAAYVERDPSAPQPEQVADLREAPELARLLGREGEAPELSVRVDSRNVRVVELRSSDPRVRLYELD